MQLRLRRFLLEYHAHTGVTILLTSHYMADVMALCPRVILIHHGKLLYDGDLNALAQKMAPFKLVNITLGNSDSAIIQPADLPGGVDIIDQADNQLSLRVGRAEAATMTSELLRRLPVVDLTVQDPPIEAVIDQVYQEGV
jgi:ABC-2 type transport system ATP-binding protein